MSSTKLLLVDDDDPLRTRLARALRDRGLTCVEAANAEQALAVARTEVPDLALVDLRLPDRNGLEVVRDLHALLPETRIVVLTGYGSIATALEAVRLGAVHYLPKPADADDVLQAFTRGGGDESVALAETPESAPSLARAEWEHIQRVLGDCDGNISEAARRLGLHRRSLQRKLQKRPPAS
ncbi:MAG: response regulator [Deltaproteobacteria bacterium]|nr:response regulator [Deltaproteobacteria bacterium]